MRRSLERKPDAVTARRAKASVRQPIARSIAQGSSAKWPFHFNWATQPNWPISRGTHQSTVLLICVEKSLWVPEAVIALIAKYQVAGARFSITADVMLGLPIETEYGYWPDALP